MAEKQAKEPMFDPQIVLREIQTQSAECDRLAVVMGQKKTEAADAKGAYDGAVEKLRTLSRKPRMPLFGDDENDWRNAPITELKLSDVVTQKVIEAAGDTMGKLSEWLNAGNNLSMIKGVGELVAEKIEKALDAFWAAHPEIKRDNPTDDNAKN